MHRKARVAAALVCALGGGGAVALIPAASSASSAPTAATPMAAQTASLSKTEKTLLASNGPKTILMDPLTGDIISVTAGQASGPVPNISRHSICNTGDGCYSRTTSRTPMKASMEELERPTAPGPIATATRRGSGPSRPVGHPGAAQKSDRTPVSTSPLR
jgi:hypothetical protein